MKLKALMLAAGLALAACSATPAPEPVVPTAEAPEPPKMTVSSSACTARGGEMQQVGRAQTWQCVVKYADAGKRCTDASQCEGDCEIAGNNDIAPGAAATGVCQADSNRFGCRTTVKDGKAEATLCID
jgi:putative hemolysin